MVNKKKENQILLRSRRDRMIDMLGIGTPFPLRDLEVAHNQKAQFEQKLEITVLDSQKDVRYTVYDANKMKLSSPESGMGNEGDLVLSTPPIERDTSFTIMAERLEADRIVAQNFLHHLVVLRVGIDSSVIAFVRGSEIFTARTWIDYNDYVEIQVGSTTEPPKGFSAQSQEEVTYSLVTRYFKNLIDNSADEELVMSIDVADDDKLEVRSDGVRSIPSLFRTKKLTESTQIEVKVVEKGATNKDDSNDFLDRKIEVFVRPNPVRPQNSIVLGWRFALPGKGSQITLKKVDLTETYQLYARHTRNDDYSPDGTIIIPEVVNVEDFPIKSEAFSPSIRLLNGISKMLSEATLNEDDRARLEDAKMRLSSEHPSFPPNSFRELLKTLDAHEEWPIDDLPNVDDAVKLSLKGDQVENDHIIYIRASKWDKDFAEDHNSSLWLTQLINKQSVIRGFAVQNLNPKLLLDIQAQKDVNEAQEFVSSGTIVTLDFNSRIRIKVGSEDNQNHPDLWRKTRTQKGISYVAIAQIGESEVEVTNPVKGNGQAIILEQKSDFNIEDDLVLKVLAYQSNLKAKAIFIDTELKIFVKPNPAISVIPSRQVIPHGTFTTIEINPTQPSVHYQLWVRNLELSEYQPDGVLEEGDFRLLTGLEEIGEPVSGVGGSLTLETGQREEDSIFVIRATKKDAENGESLTLDTPVLIRVEPDLKPIVDVVYPEIEIGAKGMILIQHTQKGVKYQLQVKGSDPPKRISSPGYDLVDRAIGSVKDRREYGMRIGTDFKIGSGTDLAEDIFSEEGLYLPTGPLAEDTTFEVVATKSYTNLEVILPEYAIIEVVDPSHIEEVEEPDQADPDAVADEAEQPDPSDADEVPDPADLADPAVEINEVDLAEEEVQDAEGNLEDPSDAVEEVKQGEEADPVEPIDPVDLVDPVAEGEPKDQAEGNQTDPSDEVEEVDPADQVDPDGGEEQPEQIDEEADKADPPDAEVEVVQADKDGIFPKTAIELNGQNERLMITEYKGIQNGLARTVSLWIKSTEPGPLVAWGKQSGSGDKWLFQIQQDGFLALSIGGKNLIGDTSVLDGEWHFVSCVLDPQEDVAKIKHVSIYLDGILNIVGSTNHEIHTVPDVEMRIGQDLVNNFYKGQLAEVRLWDISQDADTILASRSVLLAGDENGLAGYWKLDEGKGQIVKDSSPNGRDGALIGGTWI